MTRTSRWTTYLQVTPLAAIFLFFLVIPIATIVVVSFFDYTTTSIIPAFLSQNYEELLLSPVTFPSVLSTLPTVPTLSGRDRRSLDAPLVRSVIG